MNDDGKLLVKPFPPGVEKIRLFSIRVLIARNVGAYGIHVMPAGVADQDIHENTGGADKKRGHQGDAPLQG